MNYTLRLSQLLLYVLVCSIHVFSQETIDVPQADVVVISTNNYLHWGKGKNSTAFREQLATVVSLIKPNDHPPLLVFLQGKLNEATVDSILVLASQRGLQLNKLKTGTTNDVFILYNKQVCEEEFGITSDISKKTKAQLLYGKLFISEKYPVWIALTSTKNKGQKLHSRLHLALQNKIQSVYVTEPYARWIVADFNPLQVGTYAPLQILGNAPNSMAVYVSNNLSDTNSRYHIMGILQSNSNETGGLPKGITATYFTLRFK